MQHKNWQNFWMLLGYIYTSLRMFTNAIIMHRGPHRVPEGSCVYFMVYTLHLTAWPFSIQGVTCVQTKPFMYISMYVCTYTGHPPCLPSACSGGGSTTKWWIHLPYVVSWHHPLTDHRAVWRTHKLGVWLVGQSATQDMRGTDFPLYSSGFTHTPNARACHKSGERSHVDHMVRSPH